MDKNEIRLPGVIVRSIQGRDRFRTFAVVEIDPDCPTAPLVIADGKLHPLKSRKHKNPAHLRLLGVPGESDRKKLTESPDDGQIAEICAKYEIRLGNEKKPLDRSESFDL